MAPAVFQTVAARVVKLMEAGEGTESGSAIRGFIHPYVCGFGGLHSTELSPGFTCCLAKLGQERPFAWGWLGVAPPTPKRLTRALLCPMRSLRGLKL